jgi:hypothetical protein
MAENPYLSARSVEELRAMEKALYDECFVDGKEIDGSDAYYEAQMELFDDAFASLFPDEYDYHRRGREQTSSKS